MVFCWHFLHGPVPHAGAPTLFFLSVLDEGHTGVGLFMTLSGYLFARLLDGRTIRWRAFFLNRLLRLLPLLLIVIVIANIRRFGGLDLEQLALEIVTGFIHGILPNGGWSIAVELHFYALLPALLALLRRDRRFGLVIVIGAVALRAWTLAMSGQLRDEAYYTLLGHIDHFVLGMLAWQARQLVVGRARVVAVIIVVFLLSYWMFDRAGGFYGAGTGTSLQAGWLLLPTLEGVAYGVLIAWYGDRRSAAPGRFSRFIALQGEYSYSIYLLHFFFVFEASEFIHGNIMDIADFWRALVWAVPCFLIMGAVGGLSYHLIERPFLRFRRPYVRRDVEAAS